MSSYFDKVDPTDLTKLITKLETNKLVGNMADDERPDYRIFIRDYDGSYKGMLAPSEIFTNTGWKKSGKSRFLAMIVAACLNADGHYYDHVGREPLVKVLMPKRKMNIVLNDTELTANQMKMVVGSICRAAGLTSVPENLHTFRFKGRGSYAVKAAAMFSSIHQYAQSRNGLFLTTIDVGTDFVKGINDYDTCTEFWSELEAIGDDYRHLTLHSMHMNKNNASASGVFGKGAEGKSSFMTNTFSDGDIDDPDLTWKVEAIRNDDSFREKKLKFSRDTGLPVEV